MKTQIGTINITPKWVNLYPLFKEWILHGKPSQKDLALSEFKRLCEFADKVEAMES